MKKCPGSIGGLRVAYKERGSHPITRATNDLILASLPSLEHNTETCHIMPGNHVKADMTRPNNRGNQLDETLR